MKSPMLVALFAAAGLSLATPAMAEDAKPLSVAVINIQQIMSDSTAAKSVREQLESKQKAFQAEITKKEESLQKEDQELAKQKAVLAKDAFEKKAVEFRKKAAEVQKEVQSKKALLDSGFEQALGDIQKAVNEVIADLAKEKGYTLVVPTSQILYADNSMDVSKEVLDRLNKKLPKVSVKFEAKKK